MRRSANILTLVTLAFSLALPPIGHAQTTVEVPFNTQVPLSFASQIDSSTAKEGQAVSFAVASDVMINRQVVIKKGSAAQGLVVSVSPPGIFGRNARVHIAFLNAMAVDGLPLKLSPVDITPGNLRETKDTGGAAGASVVGLILLGPIGAAAGALVRGGHVTVPAGAVAITSTTEVSKVKLP